MAELCRREAIVGLSAAILVSPKLAHAGPGAAKGEVWPEVQALLDGYVSERRYAGVSAALSFGDAPVSFLSAGTLAFDTTEAVNEDSLFRIYSLTKPITGIATMLLVEDGRIALDQPVREVLPELAAMRVALDPKKGLQSRPTAKLITVRQLITHSSGMSNWLPFLGNNPISNAYRLRGLTPGSYGKRNLRPGFGPQVQSLDALVRGVAQVPLLVEPGTSWNYSIGVDLMGAIIERASGHSLSQFMRQRIFEPLKMRSTGFQVRPSDASRLTTFYERTPRGLAVIDGGRDSVWLQPPSLISAGGGLVSSARDLSRFAAMLLGRGRLNRVRIMNEATARLALSNLLPPGVSYTPTGGFGAGAAVVMPGVKSEVGPPGTYSALGSSSTLMTVDPARRGIAIFLAQLNPNSGPAGASYRGEFNRAFEADLQIKSAQI